MRTASFSCLTVCLTGDKKVCGCRIRPPRHQAGQYSLRQGRPEPWRHRPDFAADRDNNAPGRNHRVPADWSCGLRSHSGFDRVVGHRSKAFRVVLYVMLVWAQKRKPVSRPSSAAHTNIHKYYIPHTEYQAQSPQCLIFLICILSYPGVRMESTQSHRQNTVCVVNHTNCIFIEWRKTFCSILRHANLPREAGLPLFT